MRFLLEQPVEDERTRDEILADRFARRGHAHGVDEREPANLHHNHQQEKEREDVGLEAADLHGPELELWRRHSVTHACLRCSTANRLSEGCRSSAGGLPTR